MNKQAKTSLAAEPDKRWQKTQCANLIRYVSSGIYFARMRVVGKLIRKTWQNRGRRPALNLKLKIPT